MAFSKAYFLLLTVVLIISNSYWVWYSMKKTSKTRIIKVLNLSDTCISEARNQANISEKWSHKKLFFDDEGKFHIITNIVLTTHRYYSKDLLYEGTKSPTPDQLSRRQKEIEETLEENLVNERVAAIHVLYEHPEIHIYLSQLKLSNSYKLVLHLTNGDPTLAMNLDYIQTYLINKTVILMNQDIYLGAGWDKVSISALRSRKIMYALTRHSPEKSCRKFASCDEGAEYVGSHDVFVFYVAANFTNEMMTGLNFGQNGAGMENVLMWYFEKHMGYRVLNPCKIVYVYHNHCVHVKQDHYIRYNLDGKSGLAPFSSNLL